MVCAAVIVTLFTFLHLYNPINASPERGELIKKLLANYNQLATPVSSENSLPITVEVEMLHDTGCKNQPSALLPRFVRAKQAPE